MDRGSQLNRKSVWHHQVHEFGETIHDSNTRVGSGNNRNGSWTSGTPQMEQLSWPSRNSIRGPQKYQSSFSSFSSFLGAFISAHFTTQSSFSSFSSFEIEFFEPQIRALVCRKLNVNPPAVHCLKSLKKWSCQVLSDQTSTF